MFITLDYSSCCCHYIYINIYTCVMCVCVCVGMLYVVCIFVLKNDRNVENNAIVDKKN